MKLIHLIAICSVAGSMCMPANAALILEIDPSSIGALAPSTGNSFNVVLINTGPSSVNVNAFTFELSTSNPDITLTGADFSTAAPYIFSGDSFDQTIPLSLNINSGQTLDAADLTFSGLDVSIGSGVTVGLGRVLFDVSPLTPPGPYSISFTGGAANSLSNSAVVSVPIDTFNSATVDVGVPEPASIGFVSLGLIGLFWGIRRAAKISE